MFDGLLSEFLTNTAPIAGAEVPLPQQYHQQTISAIYNGFAYATSNWSQYNILTRPIEVRVSSRNFLLGVEVGVATAYVAYSYIFYV